MSDIQWSDGAPIYRQLKDRVIAMMLDGILKPGDALPSVRQVAAEYQLNPITVSRAYQELADEAEHDAEVLETLITGNRIFVYPNTVQTRLFKVNYLPGRRQGASDIRVSSSAMTGAA